MPWTPPGGIQDAVSKILTRACDTAAIATRDAQNRLASEHAARGTLNSGAFVGAIDKVIGDELANLGKTISRETLGLFESVYVKVPPEATDWIRQTLAEAIGHSANGFAGIVTAARGNRHVSSAAAVEHLQMIAAGLKRDLDLELAPIEIRAKLAALTPPARTTTHAPYAADVFICHASEDKAAVAVPLADTLKAQGYSVWIDQSALKLGDRLLDKIDEGIAWCRFGVVVLSPRFFAKKWPRRELAGLAAREDAEDRPLILPVRFELSQEELTGHSPLLAAVLGTDWSEGIDSVVGKIVDVLGPPGRATEASPTSS